MPTGAVAAPGDVTSVPRADAADVLVVAVFAGRLARVVTDSVVAGPA